MKRQAPWHRISGMIGIFLALGFAILFADSRPQWLKFFPTHDLSKEGFRGVLWATPLQDIPWKWSTDAFPATAFLREDEDFRVFGSEASAITYTFRNSVFYGVRLDFESSSDFRVIERHLLEEYPASGTIEVVNAREKRWATPDTHVWVRQPIPGSDPGIVFLWGRNRVFADDTRWPRFLNPPPAKNSFPRPYVPRFYVIYRATSPVQIDGRLNEKAWQDAAWMDDFIDHQHPYAPDPWKMTRVKCLYDEAFFYVGAQLQEENVWAHLTKRDSIIYYDNDFEVFLDPTADGNNYFEFELNALNTMFDMWHELDNHRGAYADPIFDSPRTRHAVHVDGTLNYHHDVDNGWTVEMQISLADLGEWNPKMRWPIRRGDLWRINFSRVQYLHVYSQLFPYLLPYSPCEDWVLQPTDTGDLHIPELWAKAVFSDRPAGMRDEELENARPKVLPAPPAPKRKLKGMVYFPACTMTIGPDPTDPVHSPAHQVRVPAFWMDRYEVTVKEFCEFLNKGGNDAFYSPWMQIPERCGIVKLGAGKYRVVPGREDYPVVYVSPEAAQAYAASQGKTLPTEEMWERAARGTEGRTYPWGDKPLSPRRANYDFHYGGTLPVGALPEGASPEGIFDLAGNVKEWTMSRFRPYPGGKPFEHRWIPFWYDPVPEDPEYWWVNRGGGWTKQPANMASAYRDGQGHMNVGFRCVKVADHESGIVATK